MEGQLPQQPRLGKDVDDKIIQRKITFIICKPIWNSTISFIFNLFRNLCKPIWNYKKISCLNNRDLERVNKHYKNGLKRNHKKIGLIFASVF